MKRLKLILFFSFLFSSGYCQEYNYEGGPVIGIGVYWKNRNENISFTNSSPLYGFQLRYNLSLRWAIKGSISFCKISGGNKDRDLILPENQGSLVSPKKIVDFSLMAEFNFLPYSDQFSYMNTRKLTPYIPFGIGWSLAYSGKNNFPGINIPFGIGVKYKLKDRINLIGELSFRKMFTDKMLSDEPYYIKSNVLKNKNWYGMILFSLTWDFGYRDIYCK